MNFRLTYGQTSGEKNFRKIFLLAQKSRRQISEGLLGVILMFDFVFWSKSPKNNLLSFKRQKKTQLLNNFEENAFTIRQNGETMKESFSWTDCDRVEKFT